MREVSQRQGTGQALTEARLAEIEELIENYDRSQMEDDAMRELVAEVRRLRAALKVYADGSIWGVTRAFNVIWLGEQDAPWTAARKALGADPDAH